LKPESLRLLFNAAVDRIVVSKPGMVSHLIGLWKPDLNPANP
jgi:hypothetical protein